MTKIKIPRSNLPDQEGQRIVQASAVEVRLESCQNGTVCVDLHVPGAPSLLVVPLDPPAAMQLAKGLRRAVCDYLNGPKKE